MYWPSRPTVLYICVFVHYQTFLYQLNLSMSSSRTRAVHLLIPRTRASLFTLFNLPFLFPFLERWLVILDFIVLACSQEEKQHLLAASEHANQVNIKPKGLCLKDHTAAVKTGLGWEGKVELSSVFQWWLYREAQAFFPFKNLKKLCLYGIFSVLINYVSVLVYKLAYFTCSSHSLSTLSSQYIETMTTCSQTSLWTKSELSWAETPEIDKNHTHSSSKQLRTRY